MAICGVVPHSFATAGTRAEVAANVLVFRCNAFVNRLFSKVSLYLLYPSRISFKWTSLCLSIFWCFAGGWTNAITPSSPSIWSMLSSAPTAGCAQCCHMRRRLVVQCCDLYRRLVVQWCHLRLWLSHLGSKALTHRSCQDRALPCGRCWLKCSKLEPKTATDDDYEVRWRWCHIVHEITAYILHMDNLHCVSCSDAGNDVRDW